MTLPGNAAPLAGVRVVEIAGLGPAPFAAMLLADLGAEVVRIDRRERFDVVSGGDPLRDGKAIVHLDLKDPDGLATALRLIERADVLVEGFRPGTMERLGLGPEVCRELNDGLVYVRIDGWGPDHEHPDRAGHDLNFLAELGLAEMIGTPEQPTPPLNLIADFGGAGMSAVVGTLAALVARGRPGPGGAGGGGGTVVRTSLLEGAAYLASMLMGQLSDRVIGDRGGNLLDGGYPLYRYYPTADDRWLAVAALEPVFAARFLDVVGCAELLDSLDRRDRWPEQARRIGAAVRTRSAAQWAELLTGLDACVTVSRTFAEAAERYPFHRAGDHHRPHAPMRFGSAAPGVLAPSREASAAEILERWRTESAE